MQEATSEKQGGDTSHDPLQSTLRARANIERARAGLGKVQKCLTNITVGDGNMKRSLALTRTSERRQEQGECMRPIGLSVRDPGILRLKSFHQMTTDYCVCGAGLQTLVALNKGTT